MRPGHRLQVFDSKYLQHQGEVFQNLAEVYCRLWEVDENFGEYRQCPDCGRYFSYEDVEEDGVTICTNCSTTLRRAWLPVPFAVNLLSMAYHYSFAGVLLMDDYNSVLGFCWGRLYSEKELRQRLGVAFPNFPAFTGSTATHAFYLEELGVVREFRAEGYGTKMVKAILSNPASRYPNVPAILSTHRNSPSVFLYKKLGFDFVADHPEGQDRIVIAIPKVGHAKLFT